MTQKTPEPPVTEMQTMGIVTIGCFTTFIGFFTGGMIGVFIGKIIGSATNCAPLEGLPACNWHLYAGAGMLVGAVSLPAMVIWRIRRRGPQSDSTKRG
jgi:hypothetical protein